MDSTIIVWFFGRASPGRRVTRGRRPPCAWLPKTQRKDSERQSATPPPRHRATHRSLLARRLATAGRLLALAGSLGACARVPPAAARSAAPARPPSTQAATVRGRAAQRAHRLLLQAASTGFGGAVLVVSRGTVVLEGGYGFANRELRIPFTTRTIAKIGSLTKQFTAAAIVDLWQRRLLDLRAPVSTYLPSLRGPAGRLSIHRYLTHTAGMPENCGGDLTPRTREQLLRECIGKVAVGSSPARFAYSNAGYSVLAAVVEAVSGKDLDDYLKERFFRPLRMQETGYLFGRRRLTDFAQGYRAGKRFVPISVTLAKLRGAYWNLKGNGGMQSSVEDMYRWQRALEGGPHLSASLRRALLTPHVHRGGEVYYGYGWFIRKLPSGKVKQVSHSGSDGVFYSAFVWRPRRGFFLYLVGNSGERNVRRVLRGVLRAFRGPRGKAG